MSEEVKYNGEMSYWRHRFSEEGNDFQNSWYRSLMLAIVGEESDVFMRDCVVADFGCGPRGSLSWTEAPAIKLGIDCLADKYLDEFGASLVKHNMVYVKSNESYIPIPDQTVDVLFTINSLDHVKNLNVMTSEILRIMKPNAVLVGSFNLNEPATDEEPQTLTEDILKEALLQYCEIELYRKGYKGAKGTYDHMFAEEFQEKLDSDRPGILWVRARKMDGHGE